MNATISVIIPTLNGEQWIGRLLAMLEEQSRVPDEILIVDSGSTDASCAIVRQHLAAHPFIRLLEIDRRDFDHGGTRTWAAQQSSGEIIVCMTQDAVPINRDALALLVQPFSIEKIAASYGRQLPAPNATLFSEHLRRFNYPAQPQVRTWQDRAAFGFKTVFISNSFAAWRRGPLAEQGFFPKRLLFGEDSLTLAKVLQQGYAVSYVSEAAVQHSHNYSLWQDMRRYFDVGAFHADQHELLRQFGSPGGEGRKYVCSELALLAERRKWQLLPECLLRNAGKFAAYQLGKRYTLLPRRWARAFSMNPGWWLSS